MKLKNILTLLENTDRVQVGKKVLDADTDPDTIQKAIDSLNKGITYATTTRDDNKNHPTADLHREWANERIEKNQRDIERLQQLLNFKTSHVTVPTERSHIYSLAKKYLEGNERDSGEDFSYDFDIAVNRGPRGGVVLTTSGEEMTNAVKGRKGWGSYDSRRLPEKIYIFPKGKSIYLYAPETNEKIELGSIKNAEQIMKKFNIFDLKMISGKGEVEGDIPDRDY